MKSSLRKLTKQEENLNWTKLSNWLKEDRNSNLRLKPLPLRFTYGMGNLNFKIYLNNKAYVLRRPPLGPIPPGANDMRREATVLNSLSPSWKLIPKSILFCKDIEIFGAPFQIIEYRKGIIFSQKNSNIKKLSKPQVNMLGITLIKLLSKLNTIEPKTVGLENFGYPKNFILRQLNGWAKRLNIACKGKIPNSAKNLFDELSKRKIPESKNFSILHNDFKLDNVIFDLKKNIKKFSLTPKAIIDWDQSTLGDPLYDLATFLSYWNDEQEDKINLNQLPGVGDGFPNKSEAILLYKNLTNYNVSYLPWIYALANFKLGVVFLQLYNQYENNLAQDSGRSNFNLLSHKIFSKGLESLKKDLVM